MHADLIIGVPYADLGSKSEVGQAITSKYDSNCKSELCQDIKQNLIYQDLVTTHKAFINYLDNQDVTALEIEIEKIQRL
ncbi:MAG: hypothetical protein MTP17_03720 [Candidatus Midichloria sp.]|nr:MAG: hypothetical protein MTP17_03720 [Candidatus Midichloria sp.]